MPTFETPSPISAAIDVPIGEVRIDAGDHSTTSVEVRPTDASNKYDVRAAEQTRVEYADERLVVTSPKPRAWQGRNSSGSVDVTIALPTGSSVEGDLGSADIQCDGALADCRIKTGLGHVRLGRTGTLNVKSGAGDISVERVSGHAEVSTGSGDVRVRELETTAVIKNSNGDTWVGVAEGDVRLKAANGRIAVDRALGDVDAKSANGDVSVGEVGRGSVVLQTQIGDVEVGIREGVAVWLDVNAIAGKVLNGLDAAAAPEPSTETMRVSARTTLGNVAIRRIAMPGARVAG